ncbi:TolB protein [Natronocella acetinitrilica]|uniref:Tol-Pal system protein TolB n=1 Tax=Natronocella acetinitrilica TaxID=414046 RepID=A0AAE3KFI2_9GAMM|nr:Tol-Pal system beta propeller repeat protein TolB [Natronocella acetinitrilica]MCP1674092.1 TolB protein [Natronocella acetinitrilica]
MPKRLAKLLTVALTLALCPVVAKSELLIEITGGAEAAVPIAVVPFGWSGSGSPPQDIGAIISNNLTRSGQFELLPQEDFIERPTRREQINFGNWRALGVDHLVIGEVEQDGDRYRVSYQLLDVFAGSSMAGRRYSAGVDDLRTAAHTISDEIYEELLGRPGAFNTRIAYVAISDESEGRRWRLVFADADGHYPESILSSREPIMSPSWSPDGQRLAYVSFESRRSEIFVQEIATGERERVASFEGINSAPSWSPDGRRLAVTRSRGGQTDIHVLDLSTGETRQVTDHWAIDTEAVWTPDGRHLIFTSDRAGGPQIYRVRADGGQVERLTFEGNYNASPALSPDGRQIAMVHRNQRGYVIAVQDIDGRNFRVLTRGEQDESPSFAPNGALILYATRANGRHLLGTASLFGDRRQTMSTEGQRIREPAWSP